MPKGRSVALSGSMRPKFACFILLTTWVYAAWPSLTEMLQAYKHGGYNYQGFLALPIFFILMQQQRSSLNRIKLTSSNLGLLFLLMCGALWLFASITTLGMLQQIALISMLPAIVMCTCGHKISWILSFPLLSLFLLVPIGQSLYEHCVQFISTALLKSFTLINYGVFWENQTIYIANQEYSLIHVTAALKFLTLYVSLGFIYAAAITKNIFKRIFCVSQFILVPVIMLYVTFFAIMLFSAWQKIGTFSNSRITLMSWVIVTSSLCVLMLTMLKMRNKNQRRNINDGIDWRSDYTQFGSRWFTSTIVASILILILPGVAKHMRTQQHFASGWDNAKKISHTALKDVAITIKYKETNSKVTNYDKKTWRQVKTDNLKIKSNNKKVAITETVLVNKYQGKLIWTVNYANGHLTNSPVVTKVLENMYALSKEGAKTAQITISTDIGKDLVLSRQRLNHALNELRNYEKTASRE